MADSTVNILLIEDDPGDVRLITGMIVQAGARDWDIRCAGSFREASEHLENETVDAVLLDVGLPDESRLDTVRRLRSLKPNIPIVVLSGLDDEETAIQAIREGSQDYLVKGRLEASALSRSITYAIERKRNDQARAHFINEASHELRTPLSILKISIHNLNKYYAGPVSEQQKKMLTVAEQNVDRLMRFIDNLLDFARLEAGKSMLNRRYMNAASLIRDVSETFGVEAAERNLEIESDISSHLPEVCIDGAMIERVLGNLLSNAVHFAKKTIRVEARMVDGNGSPRSGIDDGDGSACSGRPPELHGLLVSVTDDGAGIPEDRIGELFGKFAQLRNQRENNGYRGTGLGLAICREIMEKHQAHIWAESTPGSGASFHLLFPV